MADNNIPAIIDTAEALAEKLAAMRQAQRAFANSKDRKSVV